MFVLTHNNLWKKAIKGFLTYHKVRFDKTHDIAILIKLTEGIDHRIAGRITAADADLLTKFAVRIRYPEESNDPLVVDQKLATTTIKIAESVYDILAKAVS